MMSLKIEIMTMQQNVQWVNVEDLVEAAIQRCSLKKAILKILESWKQPAYVFNFLKSCRQKPCSLHKDNSFRIFLQGFCFVCFEIFEYFKNIYFTEHLSVNAC